MATANIDASKQTFARSGTKTSWSAARDATSSLTHTNYTTTSTNTTNAIAEAYLSGRGGGAYVVQRSLFFFDTSTIIGTITAISLKIVGVTNTGNAVRVAKSTAFGTTGGSAYANGDFDTWTNPTGAFPPAPVPYNASNYTWGGLTNTIALNATAISDANNNSYLNLILVGGTYDYPNTEPTADVEKYSGIQFASSTEFPKLAITYTPSGYGNNVNGIYADEIVTINEITTADIVKVIGV
jgi:hypothetical protein